ncbi:MAG: F0F1 ATP synthase subunit B [Proteobacteria bacterium]|nr:F0F1 ATP synthase subunit B [Pseudomonadota bacterium]
MNLNFTLIGQSLTFFVFVWFCLKYIWPPLKTAMRERQEAIAQGLSAAEQAQKDLAAAHSGAELELTKAKEEAQGIIEQARNRANQMVEEAKQDARDEGLRLKEAAVQEIEQEMNRAKATLRSQVAVLALAGAEKVLESSIDASRHSQMLDRLAQEL